MNIIAIVGMCGSGKSVASEIFKSSGYEVVYFGEVTLNKLKEEGLEINPINEKMMREKLRKIYGMGAFAKLLLPKIEKLNKENNVVLDGLYSYEELKILKDKFNNIKVVSIVCDKDIRYERLSKRKIRPLTKSEAISRDISEVENINKAIPIALADYYILNNSSIEDYKNNLKELVIKL